MGWFVAFVLLLVVAFLLGAAWWLLVILCLVAGVIGLLVLFATSFQWGGF